MPAGKMHDNEVATSVTLVRRLLAAQFPHWAALPLEPVPSAGTDNAIYRLGHDMTVRLPRIDWAIGQADKEREWLPKLAPWLPLAVPVPLAQGKPDAGYPWHWSVYRWLEGENIMPGRLDNPTQAALDMAHFITSLQRIDPTGGPLASEHNLRGTTLVQRDEDTREAIMALDGMFDTRALIAVWETALQAPDWDRAPVWFHGDLLVGNVLFNRGRVSAIIDFGGLGVGDPACDLMIAWGLFSGESRALFRAALQIDDATWVRGRGHALSQAAIFIPYYLNTNPLGVGYARHTIAEILTEYNMNGRKK